MISLNGCDSLKRSLLPCLLRDPNSVPLETDHSTPHSMPHAQAVQRTTNLLGMEALASAASRSPRVSGTDPVEQLAVAAIGQRPWGRNHAGTRDATDAGRRKIYLYRCISGNAMVARREFELTPSIIGSENVATDERQDMLRAAVTPQKLS